MYKGIDPDYYGYRDEDDGVIVGLEEKAEAALVASAVQEWQEIKRRKRDGGGAVDEDGGDEDEEVRTRLTRGPGVTPLLLLQDEDNADVILKAHVPVPSQEDMEKLIMKRKKASLMAKYASTSLQEGEEESKALLNIQR